MIYILVNKQTDDYSSLTEPITFIFPRVNTCLNPDSSAQLDDINWYVKQLTEVLQNTMTDDDSVIFNGPSWLIAIAGYIYFQLGGKYNVLTYNNKLRIYQRMVDPFVSVER